VRLFCNRPCLTLCFGALTDFSAFPFAAADGPPRSAGRSPSISRTTWASLTQPSVRHPWDSPPDVLELTKRPSPLSLGGDWAANDWNSQGSQSASCAALTGYSTCQGACLLNFAPHHRLSLTRPGSSVRQEPRRRLWRGLLGDQLRPALQLMGGSDSLISIFSSRLLPLACPSLFISLFVASCSRSVLFYPVGILLWTVCSASAERLHEAKGGQMRSPLDRVTKV
jgi:hypothetical protein